MGVAKVAVSPPFSRLISKLFSDEQPLPNMRDQIKIRINKRWFEVIKTNTALKSHGEGQRNIVMLYLIFIFS